MGTAVAAAAPTRAARTSASATSPHATRISSASSRQRSVAPGWRLAAACASHAAACAIRPRRWASQPATSRSLASSSSGPAAAATRCSSARCQPTRPAACSCSRRRRTGLRSLYTACCTSRWVNPIPARAPSRCSTKIPAAIASSSAGSGSSRPASAAAAASSQRWPSIAAATASSRAAGLSEPTRRSTAPAREYGTRSTPLGRPRPSIPSSSSTARQYSGLPPVCSSRRATAQRGNVPIPSARPSATTSPGLRPPRRTRLTRWSPARKRCHPSPSRDSSAVRADTATST